MERVHVVVAIGCTPVVHVFDNRDAAELCYNTLNKDYEKVYVYYDQDVLDDFAKYACPRCGSATFKVSWTEPFYAILEYDPGSDRFDLHSQSNAGDNDADDVEIECDSCGTTIDNNLNGDLEDRLWGYIN